ncbi:MAG: di-trans,poly-cis-decaprenylcistransferase [Firmicutes bacterium ZCTH02-B6]|nr:MAG: di-trans,poly-cis-decaprenylcistransferase [Firmicutes bacterium ZCTH02-B6]
MHKTPVSFSSGVDRVQLNGAGEEQLLAAIDRQRLPVHVAIIMDGNGRWATRRSLPRVEGHRAGVGALRETVEACGQLGVRYLTVYAFSTENWERPEQEVGFLMDLLMTVVEQELPRLVDNGVGLRVIGDMSRLPARVRERLTEALKMRPREEKLGLSVALNYGGRAEIARAARLLAHDVVAGKVRLEDIDEAAFSSYLYTAGLPDPDLVIRTGGEHRISNFLLWQLAYSELWITPVYWPDFRRVHLYEAILDYQRRQRRFGRI